MSNKLHGNIQCAHNGECHLKATGVLGTECLKAQLTNKIYVVHIIRARPISHGKEARGGRIVVRNVPQADGQCTFSCPYHALAVGKRFLRTQKHKSNGKTLSAQRMGKHSSTCPYAVHVTVLPSVPGADEMVDNSIAY